MQEMLLLFRQHVYLLYKDEQNRLLYSHSADGSTIKAGIFSEAPVEDFCADIDTQGAIHIVYSAKRMLSYLVWKEEKLSSYHLTRLTAPDHALTSMQITADQDIRLYYTLRHAEGTSIILYHRRGEVWSGSRIHHSPNLLTLLLADKRRQRVFFQEQWNGRYRLMSAGTGIPCIYEGDAPFLQVQIAQEHILYECGERIFDNGLLIAAGTQPCLYQPDGQLLLAYRQEGQFYKMQFLNQSWQNQSGYPAGSSYRLYAAATPEASQSYIFSPPFPAIRMPALGAMTSAVPSRESISYKQLEDEAYLQKRTIFNLQAEIKALQQRLARLEKRQEEQREQSTAPLCSASESNPAPQHISDPDNTLQSP